MGGSFTTTCDCDTVSVTYDVGLQEPFEMSNKTLHGIGIKGVLNGMGLFIQGNNVIIQKHFHLQLEPSVHLRRKRQGVSELPNV